MQDLIGVDDTPEESQLLLMQQLLTPRTQPEERLAGIFEPKEELFVLLNKLRETIRKR